MDAQGLIDELGQLIARHARPDMSTEIDGVMLATHDVALIEHSLSGTVMALIAQGVKRLALGDRVYEYGAGQYLVSSMDLPVTGEFIGASVQHPALGFGLALRPAEIAELLLQDNAAVTSDSKRNPPPGMSVSDASTDLLDAAVRLLRLLDRPRDIAIVAPLIKREILWYLVVGSQGATVRQLGLPNSNLGHMARATRWIRQHHARPFRVEDVAEHCGMSISAFYRNFQAVTAMSPIQYQKQIRLQQARLMLAGRPDDVAGVGYEVGYDSPSQFSREYRRHFGAPPSQDALRLARPPKNPLSAAF